MEHAITAFVVVALAVAFAWAGRRFTKRNLDSHADLSSLVFWSILAGGYILFLLLIAITVRFLPALLS